MSEQIAKIRKTFLGWEDHGIFTVMLDLDYGASGQGAGQYALDRYDEDEGRRVGTSGGLDFIMGILRACGVDSWEKVQGRTVIAIRESDGWNGLVRGLKPLPTEQGEEFLFETAFLEETRP